MEVLLGNPFLYVPDVPLPSGYLFSPVPEVPHV
jgi:hypothetical protein